MSVSQIEECQRLKKSFSKLSIDFLRLYNNSKGYARFSLVCACLCGFIAIVACYFLDVVFIAIGVLGAVGFILIRFYSLEHAGICLKESVSAAESRDSVDAVLKRLTP